MLSLALWSVTVDQSWYHPSLDCHRESENLVNLSQDMILFLDNGNSQTISADKETAERKETLPSILIGSSLSRLPQMVKRNLDNFSYETKVFLENDNADTMGAWKRAEKN